MKSSSSKELLKENSNQSDTDSESEDEEREKEVVVAEADHAGRPLIAGYGESAEPTVFHLAQDPRLCEFEQFVVEQLAEFRIFLEANT